MIPEGLNRVTGCRACDEGRYLCDEHRGECDHSNREDTATPDADFCLDCGQYVALIGFEDEEGHPTWDVI